MKTTKLHQLEPRPGCDRAGIKITMGTFPFVSLTVILDAIDAAPLGALRTFAAALKGHTRAFLTVVRDEVVKAVQTLTAVAEIAARKVERSNRARRELAARQVHARKEARASRAFEAEVDEASPDDVAYFEQMGAMVERARNGA